MRVRLKLKTQSLEFIDRLENNLLSKKRQICKCTKIVDHARQSLTFVLVQFITYCLQG